jgi:hypothetical protein
MLKECGYFQGLEERKDFVKLIYTFKFAVDFTNHQYILEKPYKAADPAALSF